MDFESIKIILSLVTLITLVILLVILRLTDKKTMRLFDELRKELFELDQQIKKFEAELRFDKIAIHEAAEWATGVDVFRREFLQDHPKIRARIDAKKKADDAEMAAAIERHG